jgi:hypothetical protein
MSVIVGGAGMPAQLGVQLAKQPVLRMTSTVSPTRRPDIHLYNIIEFIIGY